MTKTATKRSLPEIPDAELDYLPAEGQQEIPANLKRFIDGLRYSVESELTSRHGWKNHWAASVNYTDKLRCWFEQEFSGSGTHYDQIALEYKDGEQIVIVRVAGQNHRGGKLEVTRYGIGDFAP